MRATVIFFTLLSVLSLPGILALAPTPTLGCYDEVVVYSYIWPATTPFGLDGDPCVFLGPNNAAQARTIPLGTTTVEGIYFAISTVSGGVDIRFVGLGIDMQVPAPVSPGTSAYHTVRIPIDPQASGTLVVTAVVRTTGVVLAQASYTAHTGTPMYDQECSKTVVFSRMKDQDEVTIVDLGTAACNMYDAFLMAGAQQLNVRSQTVSSCTTSRPHYAQLVGLQLDGNYVMRCSKPPIGHLPTGQNLGYGPLAYYADWIDIPTLATGALDVTEYDYYGVEVGHVVYRTIDDWTLHAAD